MQSTRYRHALVRQPRSLVLAIIAPLLVSLAGTSAASAGTLDRIRDTGKFSLGYRVNARPFSYQDASGSPTGYSIALCQGIADAVKAQLGLADLVVQWVPVALDQRFAAVSQGKVDLLCAADTVTLSRRSEVSFSLPIYPGGIGAAMRADTSPAVRDVLLGRASSSPIWRASPAQVLETKTFSVVSGTTAERWLLDRLDKFDLDAKVTRVENYDSGIADVLHRDTDVFFGDRPILLGAAAGSNAASDLIVLDRMFTSEPLALTLAKNDDDFRLVVDRVLSAVFASAAFPDLYAKWFGAPDQNTVLFFRQNALTQ